jgi:hypothetical protein
MKPNIYAPQLPSHTRTGSPGLDIVVPFTTRPLTRAALSAAGRLSAGLLPLIRMVRTQVVPFPLQLEAAPVSVDVLRRQLAPLAEEFGARLQVCFTRDTREGLLHVLSKDSLILIAALRRPRMWRLLRWWPSREERLASWLRDHGYNVMLEFVEKNNA